LNTVCCKFLLVDKFGGQRYFCGFQNFSTISQEVFELEANFFILKGKEAVEEWKM